MKQMLIVATGIGIFAVGVVAVFLNKQTGETVEHNRPVILLQDSFFNEDNFASSVIEAQSGTARDDIQAIVVPHHLLASSIIADMFVQASGRTVQTIFLIGPNHDNIGGNMVTSADACWQTHLHEICTSILAQNFLRTFTLVSQPKVFEKEHSIGVYMPYIAYYFPHANVVPIVLSSDIDAQTVGKITEWVNKAFDKHSLLIVSIDFSHYLPYELANVRDEQTRTLIERYDIESIMRLGNENVDSPGSLSTALLFAQYKDLNTEFVHHSNSFDLLLEKPSETTSYFGIVFSNTG